MSSEEQIKKLIPAEFFMISGSGDAQTSADVHNVGQVRFFLTVPTLYADADADATLRMTNQ
jgi:hypothetical protein